MSIHAALNHVTHYKYDRPVQLGPQVIRLRPAPHSRSTVVSYSLKVEPANHFINWQQDPFANYQARLVFPEKTTEFKVTVDLVVEMAVYNPFDFFLEPSAENFPFKYEPEVAEELAPYLATEPLTPLLESYIAKIDRKERRTIDFLVAINQQVQGDVRYLIRMEPGVQTPEQTLANASGSCRDSGWLLVQLMRNCGLAARFVSGYLIQLTPDVKALDGPSGTTVDFTDLHAWCEVYLPGAGWVGLDPTSGLLAGEGHIPLACTPQPSGAAPIEGVMDEAEVEFAHHMEVTRIFESPRVTKPYTQDQWAQVLALGQAVDRELQAGDVRLTMGGEPTYVATADRDAAEWNTDALGPTKRGYAQELVHKLRNEYGRGGFLHFGQGKWYPGEQLPRWALSIYWRADGQPAWKNPALFANEAQPSQYTSQDAQRFITTLAHRLGVTDGFIKPGYEDVFYYLWRERRLPVNVDPFDSRLDDEMERVRLRRVFEQKLESVVGYVLPLSAGEDGTARLAGPVWSTGPWFVRDERIYLIPGDSPMGLRLPLDSIPWVAEKEFPWLRQQDPSNPNLPVLPKEFPYQQRFVGRTEAPTLPGQGPGQRAQRQDEDPSRPPAVGQSAPWIIRTALCVEPRDGRLHVFMPPVEKAEDYLDLIAGIETAVTEMGVPIIIEGETPPKDPRLNKLAVTPDPGVIEVNMHPSKTWDELVQRTEILYEEARQMRLGTEKFMLDGRHTGTGGGNHIIIGAETPGDSPVLRRPDLLRSLLAYWQNHPSLSWLFSGLFVGPTSQAPRIDEARNDSLYELDVAFKEMDRQMGATGQVPPWLVDRLFRNLLIDSSGNTHRSEFSIDKLFAPESSSGRLGLVEMRAFEMPPHAHMSLAQHLVLRGLISKFWKEPYQNGLVRWGTDIHDRWMLPHFCETDFRDVINDLREAGYPFEFDWFAPHFEFRFPRIGDLEQRDLHIELRTALEPWHVLGEEPGGGGTVRYVDSSLERLQIKARGLVGDRFAITCNGHRVPLHPTGTNGEGVAGVRYRAWQPPGCLHPTIGVHAPLRFDLHDTWNQRSLGGCTYHVAHPGGRGYDTFPVNSYEAESRRLSRFFRHVHTPGKLKIPPAPVNADFPFTLDLRTV